MNVLLLFLIAFIHPTLLLLDCVDQPQPLMLPDRIILTLSIAKTFWREQ